MYIIYVINEAVIDNYLVTFLMRFKIEFYYKLNYSGLS